MTEDVDQDFFHKESPISKLIKWMDNESAPGINVAESLIGLATWIEHKRTEFLGRDPDPFDEGVPCKVPVADVYADIQNYLIDNSRLILKLISTYIITPGIEEDECRKLTLRLLCSVLHCCNLSSILSETKIKDQFYNNIFEWALSDDNDINVYSTYIAGLITKEDNDVIAGRKPTYKLLISKTMSRLKEVNKINRNMRDSWNLQFSMNESTQQRLLIFLVRRVAESQMTMISAEHIKELLSLIKSWLRAEPHDDILLVFEALRLLMKLLCQPEICIEFYDNFEGITLLLMHIPRPSIAANAISFCLYNMFNYDKIVHRVTSETTVLLNDLYNVLFWIIRTCHPSARCYGMLCIQHLIRKETTLKLFNEQDRPRCVLSVLDNLISKPYGQDKFARKDYFGMLNNILNTMKTYLEQSLIELKCEQQSIFRNMHIGKVLRFPSETETAFIKEVVADIPFAIILQKWEDPYTSGRYNIIKVLYSKVQFFEDAYGDFPEIVYTSIDILSLLCMSNKFVVKFFDFTESNTEDIIKFIFGLLMLRPNSVDVNHVKTVKSILFFLGILCCRPLPVVDFYIFDTCLIVHQQVQNKLWNLMLCYNVIPKLLKILKVPLSPLDTESVRISVYHVLSGMSRSNDILLKLRELPAFNSGVLGNLTRVTCDPNRMGVFIEFCAIVRFLIHNLKDYIDIDPALSLYSKYICAPTPDQDRPATTHHDIKRRRYDSTSQSINNQMLHRFDHNTFKPRLPLDCCYVFPRDLVSNVVPGDLFSNRFDGESFSEAFCFSKGLEDGLFFASTYSHIVFVNVDQDTTPQTLCELDYGISNLEHSENGQLLMASSDFSLDKQGAITLLNFANPNSDGIGTTFSVHTYKFGGYSEFNKTDNMKFIVSQEEVIIIADVETGATQHYSIMETKPSTMSIYVDRFPLMDVVDRATFSYDDNLVLSHGMIWDMRCSNQEQPISFLPIRKVDKKRDVSGVFHPNGRAVIFDRQVWDMRKWHPVQCIHDLVSDRVTFNERGDFFYTYGKVSMHNSPETYQNVIRCSDSRDYSVVATVAPVSNNNIGSLKASRKDFGVAVILGGSECHIFGATQSNSSSYDNNDDVGGNEVEDNENDHEFVMDIDRKLFSDWEDEVMLNEPAAEGVDGDQNMDID